MKRMIVKTTRFPELTPSADDDKTKADLPQLLMSSDVLWCLYIEALLRISLKNV